MMSERPCGVCRFKVNGACSKWECVHEVKGPHWIFKRSHDNGNDCVCSECGFKIHNAAYLELRCPECGAFTDGRYIYEMD